MKRTLIEAIAARVTAYQNCIESGNSEWEARHLDAIGKLEGLLPSGSGFDSGTKVEIDLCKPERVVLSTAFHHMDENGYYDGWTEHKVWATPSFVFGVNLRIDGRDRNGLKDYAAELFRHCLDHSVDE